MCGIFGFTTRKDLSPNAYQSLTKELFYLSESRGKEAAGLAMCLGSELHVYKEPARASKFLKTPTFERIMRLGVPAVLIGHARLVTDGDANDSHNNQPVIRGGIAAVHNGIITNHKYLWTQLGQSPTTRVDTEILPAMLRSGMASGQTLEHVLDEMNNEIEGTVSAAFLFDDLPKLALLTNNGSLYAALNDKGEVLVFASEEKIVRQVVGKFRQLFGHTHIRQIKPGTAHLVPLGPGNSRFKMIEHNSEIKNVEKKTFSLSESDRLFYEKELESAKQRISKLERCSRCILPETMPFLDMDEQGVCWYCRNHKPIARHGMDGLKKIAEQIRSRNKKPNCLFPLSGGRDSSYALHYIKKELGLEPVSFSYDWGMLTDLGRRNQARMCGKLGVEHIWVSADINQKRDNIRKNVSAWLKRPRLGTVPLFMAGDKQYFYHAVRLSKELGLEDIIYSGNPLEKADFKSGFLGIRPIAESHLAYRMRFSDRIRIVFYYLKEFLLNPAYINSSLWDTFKGFVSYYLLNPKYIYLYNYLPWDEEKINKTLTNEYNWELAPDSKTTWRIGDGTAAFYNFIYYILAGFTEHDTFRSNQIREGLISRDEALRLVELEHQSRLDSIIWYCNTIGLDPKFVLDGVLRARRLY